MQGQCRLGSGGRLGGDKVGYGTVTPPCKACVSLGRGGVNPYNLPVLFAKSLVF